MTPQQIQLVRSSFGEVAVIAPRAAEIFYRHLSTADPALARLLEGSSDRAEQGQRLMQMIGSAVALIDQPDGLVPVSGRRGERHAGCGVQPQDCDNVGAALLRTLAQGLGDAFDDETCDAWCEMVGTVSRTMLAAAVGAERDPIATAG